VLPEFQRKGDAVHAVADLHHRGRVVILERKLVLDCSRPLDEQVVVGKRFSRWKIVRVGHR
jgi:hypothetical protein